jgi:hypothetical protein
LITSGIALELGRTVAAVPGLSTLRRVGSNRILFEASFIARVEDVCRFLWNRVGDVH